MKFVRRIIPLLFFPLCLIASVLAAAPWLRSFPLSVAGAPLYGAAVLSVLVPLVAVRIRPSWLWLAILVDAVAFVVYTLTVVMQAPLDVAGLIDGLYRGPSQLLTFALPLVSPRTLMVAPAAMIWLAGALAGQCIARRWYTLLPYVGFLVSFGLAYAGTQRAAGPNAAAAHTRETLMAAALLGTLMLMRVAQTWVRQDETAETTQPDGILPLRGLVVGTVVTMVIALGASLAVQSSAFPKRADTPQRVPSVNDANPLSPLSFVAGLRPRRATDLTKTLFAVDVDRATPGYIAIANVDFYDGSGWSFDRTFRPSGGVLPADTDAGLRTDHVVTQQYKIGSGAMTSVPWMPFMYRAQRVTGTSVNIDPASGMIVPAGRLPGGTSYTVKSGVAETTFDQVKPTTAQPDTTTPVIDTTVPIALRPTLDRLITSFTDETGTARAPALPFLQALQKDLQTRYSLSGAAQGSSTGTPGPPSSSAPSPTPSRSKASRPSTPRSTPRSSPKQSGSTTAAKPGAKSTAKAGPTAKTSAKATPRPTPTRVTPSGSSATSTSPASDLAGGTGFAEVLASILGAGRDGTPEQFATLTALVARELGIPARVVTGFRLHSPTEGTPLPPGQYTVTTADAWTWVEIPLVNSGWVVLDATPGRFARDAQQTESAAAAPSSSSAPPSQNALVTQGGGHAVAPRSAVPETASAPKSAVLAALAVVLGLLIVILLLVFLARKPLRASRRRRSPDPRTRLIGAWQESLDVLTEAGLPELTTLTSAEIAELTTEQFGPEPGAQAASLGTAANSVAYSAETVIEPAVADEAWARQRILRTSVRRQLGVRGRMAASLRYHRPKKSQRPTSPASWATAAAAARREAMGGASNTPTGRRYRGRRRAH